MSVGIDFGSKMIKIVDLEKSGNNWTLSGSGIISCTGNLIEKVEDEKEYAQIAQVIKKLYTDAKISKRRVSISLPEQHVFTRTVRFPSLTDQEVASAIKWEAGQYIPIPMNEATVQHAIIEKDDKATPPSITVLLVAAPTALIEKYIRLFQMAGLTVDSVESEMLALTRSLAPDNQTSVLVDFGARYVDIAIAKNKNLFFSKSVATAGDELTRFLSQALQVEAVQAEEYKRSYGMSKDMLEGKIYQILLPTVNLIVEEIKKTIHFYQTEAGGDMPKSLLLSGGGSGLIDLVPFLAGQLGIEVIIGNPFVGVKMDASTAKTVANYSPLYSIAVGLAKREV